MAEDFAPGGRGEHLVNEIDKQIDAGGFAPLRERRKMQVDGD